MVLLSDATLLLLKNPVGFLFKTLKGFQRNQGFLLAGAVAYYTLLSIVPFLILTVLILSHLVNQAELLYTLRLSLARTQLILEPFLIIGLVAVVRRVLVVTAQAERILSDGGNLEPILWELGVLAGLIISLAVALSLARRHGDGPRDLQAD